MNKVYSPVSMKLHRVAVAAVPWIALLFHCSFTLEDSIRKNTMYHTIACTINTIYNNRPICNTPDA